MSENEAKSPESAPLDPRRADWLCMAAVAVPMLVLYFVCACRTVFVGDSGELAAVAASYGVPHPSGYPLYALASGTWVRLFAFGTEAFAANSVPADATASIVFAKPPSILCSAICRLVTMINRQRSSSLPNPPRLAYRTSYAVRT